MRVLLNCRKVSMHVSLLAGCCIRACSVAKGMQWVNDWGVADSQLIVADGQSVRSVLRYSTVLYHGSVIQYTICRDDTVIEDTLV